MIAFPRILLAALLAVLATASCAPQQQRGPVVLAASSLTGAMEQVAAAWTARGHAPPVLSFAGTPALARQVEGGAPADLFVSADEEWMDYLDQRGLLFAGTRRDLLTNSLVWIAHDRVDAALSLPDRMAALQQDRLALADPASVPAGRYARQALEGMGLWRQLSARVVPAENVRAALALVENGEARFGIVYASDAQASAAAFKAGDFAPEYSTQIVYPAAQIAGSTNGDASAFLAFLSGPEAAAIFRAQGFGLAADCASC